MTAKTPAERKAAERKRRKDAGLVLVQAWALPEIAKKIREFARSITGHKPKRGSE
jgi:hypothetical protein